MPPNIHTFQEYQDNIKFKFPLGISRKERFLYCLIALAGETGEFAELVKKMMRTTDFPTDLDVDDPRVQDLLLEAGDILWYLTKLVDMLGGRMVNIAYANLRKIEERENTGAYANANHHVQ